MTRSEVGDQEEMKEDAKSALRKALDEEYLHVEEVRGKLFVGNRRGLNLSVVNRPVRPTSLRTGRDGGLPSVLSQDGTAPSFLWPDGDGRMGRPSSADIH